VLTLPASGWFIALPSAYPGAVTVAQPQDWRVAVHDVLVRCGTPTNCAGVASALVDFEPAAEFCFEARLAAGTADEDSETVQLWVAAFEKGVRSGASGRVLLSQSADPFPQVVRVHDG
jgi:hypothetical protein